MSLNIKNERVHDLARQVAARTGKSQTSAIEEALRRYLDDLERAETRDARWARGDEILAVFDARHAEGVEIPASSDFLYDDRGLPA